MTTSAVSHYLSRVQTEYKTGIAAEHAYRPALEELLESVDKSLNAVNDPKRIQAGAPDFIILQGKVPVAFVEAKDIGKDLSKVERDEQMTRYRKALPNLLLTDYLEFRWYVGGEHQRTETLGEVRKGKIQPDEAGAEKVRALLHDFISAATPTVSTAKELAQRMADMTREICNLMVASLSLPDSDSGNLRTQKSAFEQTLIPNLTDRDFADMYAQTLAYGLFAARVRYTGAPEGFTLENAFWNLPETNPFLKKLFQQIAPDLDTRVSWLVQSLAKLLAHAKTDDILKGFGQRTRQHDPIVHFYETFLSEYDPKLRDKRGVYYTPEPVVSYIVRSVDHVLQTHFGRMDGLADKDTLVLDPACGTGTFLHTIIQHVYEMYYQNQPGAWDGYVRDNLLKRLFGFELLMAPYAVAHMKLGIQLQETGYQFTGGQRLGVFLTNTLEENVKEAQSHLGFSGFITDEANKAADIKRQKPIMVVIGNPPYSGHSANKGEWISGLVRDYYQVDGKPLGERNSKWLQDDYVKFIRFGQWRINQTGSGVLAFVTNHGFLDNPTFRGMRQQLMSAFTDIYVLNLHGNSLKQEKTPDGGKDENVFDIQQGVSIGIFIKQAGKNAPAKVHHADLWGSRESKYAALLANDLKETDWAEIAPQAPFYLFIPQDVDLRGEYEQGWKVTEVMGVNVLGFQTHRDHFAIDFDRSVIQQRISEMRNPAISDEDYRRKYEVSDNRDWKLSRVRSKIKQDEDWERVLIEVSYRPFDKRYSYFSEVAMDYPRGELLQHVALKSNLCLNTVRQTKKETWQHAIITDTPAPAVFVEIKDGSSIFPLYLYPEPNDNKLIVAEGDWPAGKEGRIPNLSKKFIAEMESKLGLVFVSEGEVDSAHFTPEDVFHYAYAVFHSPTYRSRYAEFLKIDFPRLPLTGDVVLFRALCEKGAALVEAHLLRKTSLRDIAPLGFPERGNNEVAKGYPKYEADNPHPPTPSPILGEEEKIKAASSSPLSAPERGFRGEVGRVYISKTQYFANVPADVWEFHVGGYQVLEKWLKDRRERTLSSDDVTHYQNIVIALQNTIRLMSEIDALIPAWPLA